MLSSKALFSLFLVLLLLDPNNAVRAKEADPSSLSSAWRMESDDDYSYDADYRPPPPVKGLTLHGYVAGEEFSVRGRAIILPAGEKCSKPIILTDPRALPANFPERTHTEFWFYRSGDQGL